MATLVNRYFEDSRTFPFSTIPRGSYSLFYLATDIYRTLQRWSKLTCLVEKEWGGVISHIKIYRD